MDIKDMVASRFLWPSDILVMDNAANHTRKENTVLEDRLWEEPFHNWSVSPCLNARMEYNT